MRLFGMWVCCCQAITPILDEDGHAILDEAGFELESE